MTNSKPGSAFEFLRGQRVDSLNLSVEEYLHRETGAQHIHLRSENPENVFLVALRTVPHDSTGVAHILEHTALCGSKKFPVRDPFFMMIRRSLNSFMNAMTSSDWTAYPFASQNRKDFQNLLEVYLDAVFFSRLDPLDFAQEGHRLEFSDPDNPDSTLEFKGVVFNEMKGAMSSVTSTLWHTLTKYLYPTTTYHFNSGGEPDCIPNLSYTQLLEFYRSHYHPSNAIFLTFGDIPVGELQEKIQALALSKFPRRDLQISVPDESRYLSPISVEEAYAFDEPGDTTQKTHIILGWLLGKSTDLLSTMEAHLLASVLLDNSASPLQKALETTDLGTAPSPLCGLDDSQKELCFVCGIEGSEPEQALATEKLILDVLTQVVETGIAEEQVAASLHQLELQQREITGDHYPYGLQLLMTALTSATHRGDPIALLDLDPVLDTLRNNIKDPEYIKNLARKLLLENQHRVRLVLRPDPGLSARRLQAESVRLAAIKAGLDDEQKQSIVQQAQALQARQNHKDDESILPKVGLEDIRPEMAYVAPDERVDLPLPLTSYKAGTNGLVYQEIVLSLPELDDDLLELLPVYTDVLTELGVGYRSYLDTQLWQSRVCGGINAYASAQSRPENINDLRGHLVLSAKGLARNQAELSNLMQETLSGVRFDELDRIRELVAQRRARRENAITGSGHSLAMLAAASGFGPGARLANRWGGLKGIQSLKALDQSLNEPASLENLSEKLASIHRRIVESPRQFLLVGEEDKLAGYKSRLYSVFSLPEGDDFRPFAMADSNPKPVAQLWQASTQVNFCARAYATVAMDHPDAAPLTVLGGFLRNGYLHRAIREQGGAYGGGASQDSQSGSFRFYSYRDPRIEGTLEDFDRSLGWLKENKHEWQQVEEAILGVISAIDKPGSPAGEARHTYHAELHGRTREKRELFRNRVIQVSLEDLLRVADTYLVPVKASTAVITNPDRAQTLASLELDTFSL